MKNLTAVEWLEEQMKTWGYLSAQMRIEIIEHAKEKERYQIIQAHGAKLKNSKGETNFQYWYNGQDYYNDTFKNTNDEKI